MGHHFTPGGLVMFSAPHQQKLNVFALLIAFILQFMDQVYRVINGINDPVVISVARFIIGACFQPELQPFPLVAFPYHVMDDPVAVIPIPLFMAFLRHHSEPEKTPTRVKNSG